MSQKKELTKKEIIDKIISKKEFSDLPIKDVEMVFDHFDRDEFLDEEKIKLSRDLLRKMYTAFVSGKLLNIKDKEPEWFLKKHISTKERVGTYEEVYSKCLKNISSTIPRKSLRLPPTWMESKEKISIYDLGSGINGFSYDKFSQVGFEVNYFGFEAVGQLVDLQNNWFEKEGKSAICVKGSLFDLGEVKKFLSKGRGFKVVFLFKTLDSLEMLKRNYSKELLKEIFNLVDRVVISFATKSLVSKKKFYAERLWLKKFLNENFKIIDEFEAGIEKYLVVEKK